MEHKTEKVLQQDQLLILIDFVHTANQRKV